MREYRVIDVMNFALFFCFAEKVLSFILSQLANDNIGLYQKNKIP